MKVQAVFVRAFLASQEELAEFGSAERGSDQAFVVNKLVHRQDSYGTFTRVAKSHVRAITRPASWAIIYVVCIYYYFLYFSILAKKVKAS